MSAAREFWSEILWFALVLGSGSAFLCATVWVLGMAAERFL